MRDPRFAEFRGLCRTMFQIRDEMQPLEHALAVGSASEAQVAQFHALDARYQAEIRKLNEYKWEDRWSSDDRRTMSMIMHLR